LPDFVGGEEGFELCWWGLVEEVGLDAGGKVEGYLRGYVLSLRVCELAISCGDRWGRVLVD